MGLIKVQKSGKLRLGSIGAPHGLGTLGAAGRVDRGAGVLVWHDVPVGAKVFASVHAPVDLIDTNLAYRAVGSVAAGVLGSYRFERAPGPATVTLPDGSTLRTLQEMIVAPGSGAGSPVKAKEVPVFVAFSPVQSGSLVQSGRTEHLIPMTTAPSTSLDRDILRFRWVGTAVTGATLLAAAGETSWEDTGWCAARHNKLVPGSIIITLPSSAGVLRDDGQGRLCGSKGEGWVDYVTGAWKIKAYQAETGNILVDYEHSCPYYELHVDLEWDSAIQ